MFFFKFIYVSRNFLLVGGHRVCLEIQKFGQEISRFIFGI